MMEVRNFCCLILLIGWFRQCFSITQRFTFVLSRKVLPNHSKLQVVINGTVPGPVVRVTLGDTVEFKVINEIYNDATTIHWHGMSLRDNPWSDGVINITQCPLTNVPGNNSILYTFTPDRAGTYWYHGHYHEQQQDGLYGALIIMDNSETQAQMDTAGIRYDYDDNAFTWIVADWYAVPAATLLHDLFAEGSLGIDPVPDAFTVNNQFSGNYNLGLVPRTVNPRVRVIHGGSHSVFTVSVDGMPLTVIELDGVAVEPIQVPFVRLAVAQRVSFVLDWSLLNSTIATSPALWFRFTADPTQYPQYHPDAPDLNLYGSSTDDPFALEWTGLISFVDESGGGTATINTPTYSKESPPVLSVVAAEDVNLLQARPVIRARAPDPTYHMDVTVTFQTVTELTRAYVNDATMPMSASMDPFTIPEPMLFKYLKTNGGPLMAPTITPGTNIIEGSAMKPFVVPYNEVIEVLITAICCGDHPFHLHGHHFWVVSTSDSPDAESLYGDNPLVRDVVMVPAGGWARVRFVSDNPGVWWFHCHLHWHLMLGLVTAIVEAPLELEQRTLDGTYVVPDSHRAACIAPVARDLTEVTTSSPSVAPTVGTQMPTVITFFPPTVTPSTVPTPVTTTAPSVTPTSVPSGPPSPQPTSAEPTVAPSQQPTSAAPTADPSRLPTSAQPSVAPSSPPTSAAPSAEPSRRPTTASPSPQPTTAPTMPPTMAPTVTPTATPTLEPSTNQPTLSPTVSPTVPPTGEPTTEPPLSSPTDAPAAGEPSRRPIVTPTTMKPSTAPTDSPTKPSVSLSFQAQYNVLGVSVLDTSFVQSCVVAVTQQIVQGFGLDARCFISIVNQPEVDRRLMTMHRELVPLFAANVDEVVPLTATLDIVVMSDSLFKSYSSVKAVYQILTMTLESAVSSGMFATRLSSALSEEYNEVLLSNVSVAAVQFSEAETDVPGMPSIFTDSNDDNVGLNATNRTIAYITIIVGSFILVASGVIMWHWHDCASENRDCVLKINAMTISGPIQQLEHDAPSAPPPATIAWQWSSSSSSAQQSPPPVTTIMLERVTTTLSSTGGELEEGTATRNYTECKQQQDSGSNATVTQQQQHAPAVNRITDWTTWNQNRQQRQAETEKRIREREERAKQSGGDSPVWKLRWN